MPTVRHGCVVREKLSRALGRVRAQAINLNEIDGRISQGVECAAF